MDLVSIRSRAFWFAAGFVFCGVIVLALPASVRQHFPAIAPRLNESLPPPGSQADERANSAERMLSHMGDRTSGEGVNEAPADLKQRSSSKAEVGAAEGALEVALTRGDEVEPEVLLEAYQNGQSPNLRILAFEAYMNWISHDTEAIRETLQSALYSEDSAIRDQAQSRWADFERLQMELANQPEGVVQ